MMRLLVMFGLLGCLCASADEVIPPAPTHYFNDYANVVSSAAASRFDAVLETEERHSSDQIVVAVFPKMQSDAPIKDYTLRVANSWKVGQKDKNNGVTLFIFKENRTMYIQIGSGLEKVLPDAVCKKILDTKIRPRFKQGDFEGGLNAGITAIIETTQGAFQGNALTAKEARDSATNAPGRNPAKKVDE